MCTENFHPKLCCIHNTKRLIIETTLLRCIGKLLFTDTAVQFFQNFVMFFWDTLILYISLLIIKICNFRGDVSGISAETATLLMQANGLAGRDECDAALLYTRGPVIIELR